MSALDALIGKLREASNDLKNILGDGFAGLMLFGSYARGEAGERSDVDILVVLKGLKGVGVRRRVYEAVAERVRRPLTLIDIDLNDLTSENISVTPLLLNALYDGIIIYDESGALARLKSKVGELIEEAKLVRYRTPDGKYGWRRGDGGPLEAVEV